MNALILANGDPPSAEFLQRLAAEHELFLATDGAAHHAAALDAMPDIVCGDFDSARLDEARAAFPRAEFVPTPDQDSGDLEKAIQVGRDRGATAITITGAAGGRIDHTLANFALLLRYGAELPLRIVDAGSEVRALAGTDAAPGEWTLAATPGDTVSLLSLDGQAHVTVHGVRWPLENYRLPVGTLGVSNQAEAARVAIRVWDGVILACHLWSRSTPRP